MWKMFLLELLVGKSICDYGLYLEILMAMIQLYLSWGDCHLSISCMLLVIVNYITVKSFILIYWTFRKFCNTNCSESYGIRACDKAAIKWNGREAASLIEPHASRMIPEAGNVVNAWFRACKNGQCYAAFTPILDISARCMRSYFFLTCFLIFSI